MKYSPPENTYYFYVCLNYNCKAPLDLQISDNYLPSSFQFRIGESFTGYIAHIRLYEYCKSSLEIE